MLVKKQMRIFLDRLKTDKQRRTSRIFNEQHNCNNDKLSNWPICLTHSQLQGDKTPTPPTLPRGHVLAICLVQPCFKVNIKCYSDYSNQNECGSVQMREVIKWDKKVRRDVTTAEDGERPIVFYYMFDCPNPASGLQYRNKRIVKGTTLYQRGYIAWQLNAPERHIIRLSADRHCTSGRPAGLARPCPCRGARAGVSWQKQTPDRHSSAQVQCTIQYTAVVLSYSTTRHWPFTDRFEPSVARLLQPDWLTVIFSPRDSKFCTHLAPQRSH